MKTGLDDYLVSHSVEEFKKLPVREIKMKPKEIAQAEKILALAEDLELFHDQNGDAFVFIEGENILLRSKKIKQYLARLFYRSERKAANSEALNQVLNVLEAKAVFDGAQKALFNRVARINDSFFYDLGEKDRVIRTTREGWKIEHAPILFRRYSHQQNQAVPKSGGDPWQVFRFLNVSQEDQLLVLVYIASCLVPDIAHPVFHPYGAQGSGKTCFSRIIKRLLDPSSLETIITPKDKAELVQLLAHHYICLFDNLSGLPDWQSDILAQACTGGGFSKRMLYTDDEDVIFNLKRCIGLNGIHTIVTKPDLLDRTILIHLDRIDPESRLEESELWESFERVKPDILGGIFDTLSRAMRIYPEVSLRRLPRMADFSRWGYAITEALSIEGGNFLEAYQMNIERQNEEVVQNNTLMQAVLSFMDGRGEWNGTVQDAYDLLSEQVHVSKDDRTFPKHANKLRKPLNKIKANLQDYGIEFSISNFHTKTGVPISFQKVGKVSSLSSPCTQKIKKQNDFGRLNEEDNSDDTVKIQGKSKASSPVYTQHNLLKKQKNEDGEDGEDKNYTYRNKDSCREIVDLTNRDFELIDQ